MNRLHVIICGDLPFLTSVFLKAVLAGLWPRGEGAAFAGDRGSNFVIPEVIFFLEMIPSLPSCILGVPALYMVGEGRRRCGRGDWHRHINAGPQKNVVSNTTLPNDQRIMGTPLTFYVGLPLVFNFHRRL